MRRREGGGRRRRGGRSFRGGCRRGRMWPGWVGGWWRALVGGVGGDADPWVGTRVGVGGWRVEVRRKLGEGGFARVYLARDVVSGADVALKRVVCDGAEGLAAATAEVEAMQALGDHPHLVRLLDHAVVQPGAAGPRGEGEGAPGSEGRWEVLLLLEHCPGGPVTLDPEPNPAVAVRALRDCARALAHLHDRGVGHWDVKMENVLLGADGRWKLCDFGSCCRAGRRTPATRAERAEMEAEVQAATSAAYRPPEMWDLYRGHAVGEAGDLWALGCVAYALCYGALPFDGHSKMAVLNGSFRRPGVTGRAPAAMVALIEDLLQQDPGDRPPARDVEQRLDALLDALPRPPPDFVALEMGPGDGADDELSCRGAAGDLGGVLRRLWRRWARGANVI